MTRSVVLPVHNSLFAPRVIPLLAELGRRSDIHVHVVDLREAERAPVPDGREGGGAHGDDRRTARKTLMRENLLQSVSQHLSDVLGSTRVRAVVRSGEVAAQLASYAREQRAQLITLGVEDRDSIGERTALDFARTLAVASGSAVFFTAVGRGGTRGTLLADLDGTEAARAQLDLALASARIAGVDELTVEALPGEPYVEG
jgi:hypothetical protein